MGYAINYVSGGDCQNWTLNAIGNYAFIETTVDNKLYRTHICRETVARVDKIDDHHVRVAFRDGRVSVLFVTTDAMNIVYSSSVSPLRNIDNETLQGPGLEHIHQSGGERFFAVVLIAVVAIALLATISRWFH